jgi:YggT family protein
MNALTLTVVGLIESLIGLYILIIFLAVIASWLVALNVVNARNQFVRACLQLLDALTEPVFRPIRRVIPSVGGFDLSPVVVLIILYTIRAFLVLQFGNLAYF